MYIIWKMCFTDNGHLDKRQSEEFLYKCVTSGYDVQRDELLNATLKREIKINS